MTTEPTAANAITQKSADDLSILAEHDVAAAEKRALLVKRIILASINATRPTNWLCYDRQPYLDVKGCEEIAAVWGFETGETTIEEDRRKDNRGEWIMFTCKGAVRVKGREFHCMGKSSTRDAFFGRKDNQDKALEAIDLPSVKMKAYTNWFNNAVKRCLGIRGITWSDLEEVFGKDTVARIQETNEVKHKSKEIDKSKSDNPQTGDKRKEISRHIFILAGGEPSLTVSILEEATTWKEGDKIKAKGRQSVKELSEAQVNFHTNPRYENSIAARAEKYLAELSPQDREKLLKSAEEFFKATGQ